MSRGQGRGLEWDWGQGRLWLPFMHVWPERRARSASVAAGFQDRLPGEGGRNSRVRSTKGS